MALLVGALLAAAIAVLATSVGWDRDRSFYAVVTFVVASLYTLFAVIGADSSTLLIEILVGVVFILAAVVGYKKSLWIVMVALAGHGIFDIFHGALINNPGVPEFWPDFCMAFDVSLGAYFAWQLGSKRIRS
ncbi:MAG: hypothetical protein IPH75_07460 [bacterium]|nr:hypothetical protein [bacterium]